MSSPSSTDNLRADQEPDWDFQLRRADPVIGIDRKKKPPQDNKTSDDDGDGNDQSIQITNLFDNRALVFAIRNHSRYFILSGIPMSSKGRLGLGYIPASNKFSPNSKPPSSGQAAIVAGADASTTSTTPAATLSIRPNLSALKAAPPHLFRYVEEHITIYNRYQLREKCVLTLRFTTGYTSPLWYVAPSFDRSVFSRLEDTITKLIRDCYVFFAPLVAALQNPPRRDADQPVLSRSSSTQLDHLEALATHTSSPHAYPTKLATASMKQGAVAMATSSSRGGAVVATSSASMPSRYHHKTQLENWLSSSVLYLKSFSFFHSSHEILFFLSLSLFFMYMYTRERSEEVV